MPCSPPGILPDPGIEPASLLSLALAGGFFTASTTWEDPLEKRQKTWFLRLESSVQCLLCPSHISLNTQHNPRHTRNGWSETDGGGQIHTMTHTHRISRNFYVVLPLRTRYPKKGSELESERQGKVYKGSWKTSAATYSLRHRESFRLFRPPIQHLKNEWSARGCLQVSFEEGAQRGATDAI